MSMHLKRILKTTCWLLFFSLSDHIVSSFSARIINRFCFYSVFPKTGLTVNVVFIMHNSSRPDQCVCTQDDWTLLLTVFLSINAKWIVTILSSFPYPYVLSFHASIFFLNFFFNLFLGRHYQPSSSSHVTFFWQP